MNSGNPKPNVNDLLQKYGKKIESKINSDVSTSNYSHEYSTFKSEMAPEFTRYEKWAHSLGSIVKLKASEKDEKSLKKFIDIAHLEIEAWQAITLAAVSFISVFIFGIIFSVAVALIKGSVSDFPFLFFFLTIIVSIFLFYYIKGIPERLANKWRLKASSQMVPAILYLVVYMRHTPNLEKAVAFAAEHLDPPLSLDLKKVFYNVQIGKFSSMKESLDNYLETWRDYAPSFIESFHLIESSLFEPDNARRISTLEKSLQVVLDGVYDQMLKFVHNVKSPLQNTYMLGTTLPVLGIALLPLASAMVGGYILSSHVFILYNLIIPFIAFFLMNKYLMLRPGGYGETDLIERNPMYYKYKSKKPYIKAALICAPLILIGLLPLIFQYTPLPGWFGLEKDFSLGAISSFFGEQEYFFDFKEVNGSMKGPFGIGALFLGMFVPLGIAMFFVIAFKTRTKEMIIERNKTKDLENEFNNSLFQLGNRIGNGVPVENVFGRVAESAKGLMTEDFFRKVHYNVTQMGMSVDKAIFDPRRGAILYYPSNLIATSMRILVEASKKGLKVAAVSLMSISEYIKNINKITGRLRDILAEVISDMKSNMTFLAPLLSGVVVGLAGMIVAILNKLNLPSLSDTGGSGVGDLDSILGVFQIEQMIPPYYLQIAIGIYLIQIVFILTGALVAINSGEDRLQKTYQVAKNMKTGILMYFITALLSTLVLFILVAIVLGGVGG